jgi:hypothetical protein
MRIRMESLIAHSLNCSSETVKIVPVPKKRLMQYMFSSMERQTNSIISLEAPTLILRRL